VKDEILLKIFWKKTDVDFFYSAENLWFIIGRPLLAPPELRSALFNGSNLVLARFDKSKSLRLFEDLTVFSWFMSVTFTFLLSHIR
jgi:hypothetical protein